MIKYLNSAVTFAEIPTEVTLAINITNCTHNCKGCHSPELRQDIGESLTAEKLNELIEKNRGVSCVLLLGEGNSLVELKTLVETVKKTTSLKFALYSGAEILPNEIWMLFDYVKIGEYNEKAGPLTNRYTNQRLYRKIEKKKHDVEGMNWEDITHLFWK